MLSRKEGKMERWKERFNVQKVLIFRKKIKKKKIKNRKHLNFDNNLNNKRAIKIKLKKGDLNNSFIFIKKLSII